MTAVRMREFGGIAPKLNPRYLAEKRAQVATDVDTSRNGALTPIRDTGGSLRTLPANLKTLYRYNEDYVLEDGNWWVGSKNDTDFCRSQITGDSVELTYFTDNDNAALAPQFFYDQNAVITDVNTSLYLSTYYGINASYNLGVASPTIAPSVTLNNPTENTDGLSREFRTYVFTYVWKFAGREMESGPSPAANSIGIWLASGESIAVNTLTTSPPSNQMSSANVVKRVYRAVAGGYFFLGEIPVTQQIFTDDVDPDDLSEELPSLTWSPPPADLKGLVNMSNGIMAGFVGRDVYFCEPYIPHAWPINYVITLDSPIVALASLDTTLVVLTKERPYFLQGSEPSFMTVVEADVAQGCLSKRSVQVVNGSVHYAAPDGLVAVSPRGSRIITEQLFSYKQWQESFNLSSIHGYTHDLKYFGFHDAGGFIFDVPTGEFTITSDVATAAFADLRTDTMYLTGATGTLRIWARGSNRTATWRSKIFALPGEVSFSCGQVEAESYPLVLDIYTESGLLQSQTVTSRNMFRLKSILARDWYFELRTEHEVFNVVVAQSGSELAGA